MRDYEDGPYIVIERRRGGLVSFLWGVVVGVGVGLLIAPRPGRQTQEDLRRGVQRVRDTAGEARDTVTRTRDRLQARVESVRSEVDMRAQQAREVIETGRRAALDAREEIERRVAGLREEIEASGTPPGAETPLTPSPATSDFDVVVTEVAEEDVEGRSGAG